MVQPIRSELIERGSKHLARGTLGPWAQGVGSLSPRAPGTVQAERRLVWRTIACPPKDQPRSWLRLLEQGPESQSASAICAGGVSAVISASDLDGPTFHPSGRLWHRSNRALPSVQKQSRVGVACPVIKLHCAAFQLASPRCHRLAQRNPSRRAWFRFDSPKTGMASPVPKLRNGQPGRVSQRSWSQTQR